MAEPQPAGSDGLVERLNASMGVVTEAIRFGCFSRVLVLAGSTRLRLGDQKIKKSMGNALSEGAAQSLKRAERLGYWFASAGSTRTVFDMMDLTV